MRDSKYRNEIPNPYDKKPVVITDVATAYQIEKFLDAVCATPSVMDVLTCADLSDEGKTSCQGLQISEATEISKVIKVIRRQALSDAKAEIMSEGYSEEVAEEEIEKLSGLKTRDLTQLPDMILAVAEVGSAKALECLKNFDWIEYYPADILGDVAEISERRKISEGAAYGLALLWKLLKTALNDKNGMSDKNARVVVKPRTPPEKNKYRDKSGKSRAYVSKEVTYYDNKRHIIKTTTLNGTQRKKTRSGKTVLTKRHT